TRYFPLNLKIGLGIILIGVRKVRLILLSSPKKTKLKHAPYSRSEHTWAMVGGCPNKVLGSARTCNNDPLIQGVGSITSFQSRKESGWHLIERLKILPPFSITQFGESLEGERRKYTNVVK
ncbi:hypothetical protein KI387_022973, partial [Taxus chinensis]